jgi:hypothetical protein
LISVFTPVGTELVVRVTEDVFPEGRVTATVTDAGVPSWPTITVLSESEMEIGAGAVTVKLTALEDPPPGAGFDTTTG